MNEVTIRYKLHPEDDWSRGSLVMRDDYRDQIYDSGGLDEEQGEAAEAQVAQWRAAGELPFPEFAKPRQEALSGSLDYPPEGSPDAKVPAKGKAG